LVNTFAFGRFQGFHTKNNGSHVPLCKRNSGAESGRQLFKGSKEAASLAAFTRKKFADFLRVMS